VRLNQTPSNLGSRHAHAPTPSAPRPLLQQTPPSMTPSMLEKSKSRLGEGFGVEGERAPAAGKAIAAAAGLRGRDLWKCEHTEGPLKPPYTYALAP
jgi:hypothetical protein